MSFDLPRPIITLTTDFGASDHYVGTMKGVLLSRCPNATLVDISHKIPPFSLYSGAYMVDQAAPYFPPGTIHLVVVDPGVGTERKAIVAQTAGQTFVAPDNGVLSLVLARNAAYHVRYLTNASLYPNSPSATFHGRDIFAPVAASLAACSAAFEEVGPICESPIMLANLKPHLVSPGVWSGLVLSIDHFGNVITNFKPLRKLSHRYEVRTGHNTVTRFHQTFGEAAAGVCFAYAGSSGYLELGMNQESAANYLKIGPGDAITLREIPS
jgi:S-adenosyl-L-methionine hydrolase (adenosine-forming)